MFKINIITIFLLSIILCGINHIVAEDEISTSSLKPLLAWSNCNICTPPPIKCQPPIPITISYGSNWWDIKDDNTKVKCHGILMDIIMNGTCETTTTYKMFGRMFSVNDWSITGGDKTNQLTITCESKS